MSKLTVQNNTLQYVEKGNLSEAELFYAFAESLAELRKYCGLSLMTLSEKVEIPNQTLSSYENKTRTPSVIQAIKISAYFGLTIEEFILCGLNQCSFDITELYEQRKK